MLTHKVKVTLQYGVMTRNVLKSLSGATDGIKIIPSHTLMGDLCSMQRVYGYPASHSSLAIPAIEVGYEHLSDNDFSLYLESPSKDLLDNVVGTLTQHAMQYAGYCYNSDDDKWGDFKFFFSRESTVVIVVESELPYSDMDTLLGEDAEARLFEATNGLVPIFLTDGTLVNASSVGVTKALSYNDSLR